MASTAPELIVYVAGATATADGVLAALDDLVTDLAVPGIVIDVVDVSADPVRARMSDVLVTPTIICRTAAGETRFVGDLHDPTLLASAIAPLLRPVQEAT
jgi:hypothetical protein